MGMAASQARFLGLTARRNNVEFEGQQINQQRTALANESANYYNDLLGMSVPTPPSVDNFTKTVYTFTDGALTNTVTALIAQTNGMYNLSYLQAFQDDFTPVFDSRAVITRNGASAPYTYSIGAEELRTIGNPIEYTITYIDSNNNTQTGNFPITVFNNNNEPDYSNILPAGSTFVSNGGVVSNDEYLKSLTPFQISKLQQEEQEYERLLNDKYGTPTDGWMVRYVQNTTTGIWSPVFYSKDEVNNAGYDANNTSLSSIAAYKMGSEQKTTEIKNVIDCQIEKDSTGRFMSISIPNAAGTGSINYSLVTSTVTDQDAYEDAMNQYEYDKYQYDQTIQEINAKIEIVQAQDKNLELRLKQLDTEHNAIQTEMEAVQKVITKNTQDSFKVFQA